MLTEHAEWGFPLAELLGLAAAIVVWLAALAGAAQAAAPPVAGTLDLSMAAGAAQGVDEQLAGVAPLGRAGSAVAFVGDVNDDGEQDYAVGSPYADGSSGQAAVVYGRPGGSVELGAGLGDRGFRIEGPHRGALLGSSLAGGDINGDRYDDVVVGAPRARYKGRSAGAVYVVFGGPRPASGVVDLASPGSAAAVIGGAATGDRTGLSVAAAGDLDGDGSREILLGAPSADPSGRANAGAAFVVFSRGRPAELDLASIDGFGYRIDGASAADQTGYAVAGVGDMSGDGRAETVIGAPSARGSAGSVHVVWGKPTAAPAVDLGVLASQGFTLDGQPAERAGTSVAGLADATGDRIPDVVVGAPAAAPDGRARAGSVYVAGGRSDSTRSVLQDAAIRIWGGDPGAMLGIAVASAGDVDGDARADLLMGQVARQPLARTGAGATLLVLTARVPAGGGLDAALLGSTGIRFVGPAPGAASGRAVAGGTDLNHDGREDVLIGHRGSDGRRGGASVVLTTAIPVPPASSPMTAGLLATNVEAIIDDSQSLARYDPGGVLRRQALELVLTDPANHDRVFGAVEFGTRGQQVLPPLRTSDAALQGERLEVLRALLQERIASNGGVTNFAAGIAAAAQQNPAAQARIFFTDGGQVDKLSGFGDVRTYVVGLNLREGSARARLAELARATGGDLYAVADAGALQAAMAAIDARLRGETSLMTTVQDGAGVASVPPVVPDEAAAAVTRPDATVTFRTAAPLTSAPARRPRRARLVVSWDKRGSRFRVRTLRLRLRGRRTVRVTARQLRRALRGRTQRVQGGLRLKGRVGRTFLVLEVRGLERGSGGRRAVASARGFGALMQIRRIRGSRRAVVRSRWTYQRRPG